MVNTEFLRALSAGTGKAKLSTPQLATDQSYVLPLNGCGLDMLGSIANAEVAVTSAATAAISTWTHCTATSANYALNLPALSASWGLFLGVTIDATSTYLVTLTAAGSDTIDGVATRVMWAKESCILFADQNAGQWVKVGGKTIPMNSALTSNANATFNNSVWTVLNFQTNLFNNAPAAFQVPGSTRFVILRPGLYSIRWNITTTPNNSSATRFVVEVDKNGLSGTGLLDTYSYFAAGIANGMASSVNVVLAADDYITLAGYYYTGSYTTTVLNLGTPINNVFEVTELPTW